VTAADHERADELLPWLVNSRLQGEDLHWLNAHLEHCDRCRSEHLAQRRVRDALASEPALEFAPLASYNRLWTRIEAEATPSQPGAIAPHTAPARRGRRLLVAVLATQSIAIVALALALWQSRPPEPAANYRTVTLPAPAASSSGDILVIFDDATTQSELRALLGRSGLRLRDGPTAAGVYTLVRDLPHAGEPLERLLQTLRTEPRVRFAERGAESTP
jgi:hypothetical protein